MTSQMDGEADTQPTQQATQDVLDPRRIGKQASGFSDEDISDIICLLIPYSKNARGELARLATEGSSHMVDGDDADQVAVDYSSEDRPSQFAIPTHNKHAVALRLSADVKNPLLGFTFGRNATRCDICFLNDPHRRLSNIHFRIYINEYGVVMLQDQSTNGTVVDNELLKLKAKQATHTKRTLSSGSSIKILMVDQEKDIEFMVRIPRRDGPYEQAYRNKLIVYRQRIQALEEEQNATIGPGPGGHVDLFPKIFKRPRKGSPDAHSQTTQGPSLDPTPRGWDGAHAYNQVGEIGKGAFATVYKVTSKFNGLPYAAKELDKRRFMKNGVLDQKVENEMRIMQKVKHPHIVEYIDHFEWDNRLLIIIMEFVGQGDLGKLINAEGPLSEVGGKVMAAQLLGALNYLHINNITHRDVKPDNILINSSRPTLDVKLTDFGLSKIVDTEDTFLRTFCGTLLYCAPEVYSDFAEYDEYGRRHPRNRQRRAAPGQRYDHAVDIWSLGGVIFYALTGSPPFPVKSGITYSELLHKIMTQPLNISPLIKAGMSGNCIDFLSQMLQRRPESRATIEDLLGHPWLAESQTETEDVGSFDEIADDYLEHEASQLSIRDNQREASPSDDEILDADSMAYDPEAEKENLTFGRNHGGNGPRLFGEVNVSAIGSSGVLPSRLNLPVSASNFETEILGSEAEGSYESEDLSTPREPKSQHTPSKSIRPSTNQSISVEQLNNRTFDAESQDLAGTESILENLNVKSLLGSQFLAAPTEFTSSKRKPSCESSDEHDDARTDVYDKPSIKRLKSDITLDAMLVDDSDSEFSLCASVPPISKLDSGRQIDKPIHKSAFWTASDKKSYHLRYPEMTQVQYDAFFRGAQARGERFAQGQSPLWALAMKYFPPGDLPPMPGFDEITQPAITDSRTKSDNAMPSTAQLDEEEEMPDTYPLGQDQVGLFHEPPTPQEKRIVATLESAPASVVPNIFLAISESMVSWGRAPENVAVYRPPTEQRVPKFAFKILLFKDGYDPSHNLRPWTGPISADGQADFFFYISTKATNGILVNDVELHSHDCKRSYSPSKHWIRLYDGDCITAWRPGARGPRTDLMFRCSWGGSARMRPTLPQPPSKQPEVVLRASDAVSRRLDDVCARAERAVKSKLRMEAANRDYEVRSRNIERERERSRVFEAKRAEACRVLAARASRRTSPGSGSVFSGRSGRSVTPDTDRPDAAAAANEHAVAHNAARTVPVYAPGRGERQASPLKAVLRVGEQG